MCLVVSLVELILAVWGVWLQIYCQKIRLFFMISSSAFLLVLFLPDCSSSWESSLITVRLKSALLLLLFFCVLRLFCATQKEECPAESSSVLYHDQHSIKGKEKEKSRRSTGFLAPTLLMKWTLGSWLWRLLRSPHFLHELWAIALLHKRSQTASDSWKATAFCQICSKLL